jgi:hypothetical protein
LKHTAMSEGVVSEDMRVVQDDFDGRDDRFDRGDDRPYEVARQAAMVWLRHTMHPKVDEQ